MYESVCIHPLLTPTIDYNFFSVDFFLRSGLIDHPLRMLTREWEERNKRTSSLH